MSMNPRLLRPTASGFSPRSISGLANWWDAADSSTVTLNGTTVASWANRASGPALAQDTAGAQPTYTAAGVNGKNVLTFDGGDVLSASASYGTQLNTIFMVFRENSSVNFAGFFALTPQSGNDNGNNNSILAESAQNESLIVVQRGATQFPIFSGAGVLPLSVMTIRAQAVGISLRTNGSVAANNTANNFSGTSAGVLVGGRFQSGAISSSFRANMTACEILHYTAALSDADIARIEGYLAWKWGLQAQLPSNHPYAYSFPGFGSQARPSNADAVAWESAVYANSGSTSVGTLSAVDTFCGDIASAGIRDRFLRMNLFCGTGLNAALVPLFRGPSLGGTQYGGATDTNNAFVGVGTDYAETGASGGLTGNGTSKWLRTGLTTESIPDISTGHLSAYASVVAETSVIDAMISAWGPGYGNPVYALEWNRASSGALMHMWGGSFPGPSITAANGAGVGFLLSSRTSSTDLRLFKNGSQIGSTSTTDVTPAVNAGIGFGVFCNLTSSGSTPVPDNIFAGRLAAYSVGLGMTAAQAAAYNTAMQSFQTALTRNV